MKEQELLGPFPPQLLCGDGGIAIMGVENETGCAETRRPV